MRKLETFCGVAFLLAFIGNLLHMLGCNLFYTLSMGLLATSCCLFGVLSVNGIRSLPYFLNPNPSHGAA